MKLLTFLFACLLATLGHAFGLNVSAFEGGTSLQAVRAYWPDSDIAVLRGAGVDRVRLFVDISAGVPPAVVQDTVSRFALQIPIVVLTLRAKDGTTSANLDPFAAWWVTFLGPSIRSNGWRPPAGLVVDPLNEPNFWTPHDWVTIYQPALYATIRRYFRGTIILHSGGYEGIAGYPPFVVDPGIVIPTDGPVAIALHSYDTANYSAGSDAYNLSGLTSWARAKGVPIFVTEAGDQNEPDLWGNWVNVCAQKAVMFQRFGLAAYWWLNKMAFQSDVPGHRVWRYDVLAAWGLPAYAPPVSTAGGLQPVGSTVWPVKVGSGSL